MRLFNRKHRYSRYISEAIPYSDVKPYLQIDRSKDVQQKLDAIFNKLSKLKNATTSKRGDRVYIPFEIGKRTTKSNIQLDIEELLINNGMSLLDYSKGLALDKYGRKTKIGKLLRKLDKSLLQPFANDTSRVSDKIINSYIVFSKHRYDIAGMSTNRNWTSCVDIYDGVYEEYIEMDIKYGTFIAYLVSSEDKNITNPIARLNIKPFINSDNQDDIVYFSDKVYDSGNVPKDFQIQIDNILSNIQKINIAKYRLNPNMYCDTSSTTFGVPSFANTKNDIIKILNILGVRNYKINSDLTVDVNGDVYLNKNQFTKIPIRFGNVSGNFNCGYNKLDTLEGSPKIVGGDFKCYYNKLTTLEGSPNEIGGGFYCSNNQLVTLTGSPKTVGGAFYCNDNKLTSLEGSPKSVGFRFNCSNNRLKTLRGLPKKIGSFVNCSNNQLTTLQGLPKILGGSLDCSVNNLTHLNGLPTVINGSFYAVRNSKIFTKSEVLSICDVKGDIIV